MKNTPDKKQPGAQPAKKGPHRLPVILSADLQAYVEAQSVQDHISISEFIRRALRRDASLRRLYTEGSKLIIKDASGAERELVWSDAL
ncbi:hypothetical protein E2P84_44080 [Burkholderia cepacia]|uniref:CopG family transcriptional regulator n=1 Tax=Burkholderia cepacia TaxID=292 RepID=A0AAX2RQH6_BURCE|nr:hypothetical protein [Burkholderia cepacia]TES60681.1 hypothetical protein E2P84_44080 [Burkholderia cepacia]TET01644.1 hypothetical protein E3D36_16550 [Burkholderia cepacia]TEU47502.1 hypothetical protein E3D37_15980 [Burkholderia cepacia]TEU53529.1 hypothetical protein E3D38_12370 [Burkholderia cepacia]TEV02135.1 hypothetical protein E3D40_13300 [Burkholderia cepacia]